MSSSRNYTTVQQFGPRKFDAVYIRSGEVVERSSYATLSEAVHQARGLEIIGVPYRPVQPARGGFDRTATQTPAPVDVEIPLPGLLPAPEEEPQPQAEACDCFGCLVYGRCTANMVDISNLSVQDLGLGAKPGPKIPAWELEMDRRLLAQDELKRQMDAALAAGNESGRIERAADIVRDGSLAQARANYGSSTTGCGCPDAIRRGSKCKHQLAEIMSHNLAH